MSGPTGQHSILQVHPTRRCNLRCLHCYSDSGPEIRDEIGIAILTRATADAARLGYTVLGVSGGEPLLYRPLRSLLTAAQKLGMTTTVTTNGMLLDARHIQTLAGTTDLVAISLDGVPDSHNRMRASHNAFERMRSHLRDLRASGIPFGFIFTLTLHNVHEIDWIAAFAADEGASLLQIHPLEHVGRAILTLKGSEPDATESAYALLEAMRIQSTYADRLHVQLDIAATPVLKSNPRKVFADDCVAECAQTKSMPFGHLLSPLVIETDGTVVPLVHSFPRRYALGNLHQEDLPAMAERWRREILGEFRALCRTTYRRILKRRTTRLVNWYEEVCQVARQYVERSQRTPRRKTCELATRDSRSESASLSIA